MYFSPDILSSSPTPCTPSSKKGFDVRSFGTGSVVKLPGPGPEQPNVYDFGTTYQFMYEDLYRKDPHLYLSTPDSPLARSSMAVAFSQAFLFDLYSHTVVQLMCVMFRQILLESRGWSVSGERAREAERC